jgi:hypothetical protein
LARVTINCTARRSKSRIVETGYQGYHAAQDCPHTAPYAMILRIRTPHVGAEMACHGAPHRSDRYFLPNSGFNPDVDICKNKY